MTRLRALVLSLVCLLAGSDAHGQVSRNATLLSTMDLHTGYTGVWSYVHHDGREYVALGTRFGTSIVRLTVPTAPVEVAFIPGVSAGTRDMRQYRTYLYIVANFTGAAAPGIQVVSMADPDAPVLVATHATDVQTAEYANVDTTRALLFVSEANQGTEIGGTHILSLADPVNPVQVGTYTPPYRIHDFHPRGNLGYACAIDDTEVDIVDITNPAAPIRIASFATPLSLPHSSWTTEDGNFLFVTQESFGAFGEETGRPAMFDVRNPNQVELVYQHLDQPEAISHIPVIRGARAAVAYYSAGVRLFDLSLPSQPVEFGHYDTWLGDDRMMVGSYQAAALFPSGIVCAADDSTGLYVVQPSDQYGIVRGVVRVGTKALAGAIVRALPDGPATRTAPDGSYALAPSPGGAVTIQVEKYAYTTESATVSVAQGSDQPLNFTLTALRTGSVKGAVRRASDGTAIAEADVSILDTPFAGTTGSRGSYSFAKVAVGSVAVRAEYPGLVPTVSTQVLSRSLAIDFSLVAAPFYDDADTDRGWTLGDPSDDATQGQWVRAVPIAAFNGSEPTQPGEDHTPGAGGSCFVTGNSSSSPFLSRVLGGKTTLTSPPLDLAAVPDPRIVFWRWYYHNSIAGAGGGASQPFLTEISNDGGAAWTLVSQLQRPHAPWERVEIRVTDFFPAPGLVRVRFTAQNRIGSIVEALIDDFEYYAGSATAASRLAATEAPPAPVRLLLGNARVAATGGEVSFALGLDRDADVTARVYDVRGRWVATLLRSALPRGTQRLTWRGRSHEGHRVPSGVYFLMVRAGAEEARRKFLWLR